MPELFDIIPYYQVDLPAPIASVSNAYPVDVDTVGANEAQTRLTQQVIAGKYSLILSVAVNSMDQTNNAIYIRFTEDASIVTPVWEETSNSVANAGDPLFRTHTTPLDITTDSEIDIAIQMRKEAATGTLDLDRMTLQLQRVADL